MDKVAVRVSGELSFFDEVAAEAARLDRSPSWLLGHCLGATLPKLAATIAVAAPKPSVATRRRMWTFFVPRELIEHCGRLAHRLGMTSDDVLAYAWHAGKGSIQAMPSS